MSIEKKLHGALKEIGVGQIGGLDEYQSAIKKAKEAGGENKKELKKLKEEQIKFWTKIAEDPTAKRSNRKWAATK